MSDIPAGEMTTILEKKCACPPSHAKLLVGVMTALRQRRSKSSVFQGRDGLITPRDLLRWAERSGLSKLDLAREGYMLLAERLRTEEEKQVVQEEIEKSLKVRLAIEDLYTGPSSRSRKMMDHLSETIAQGDNQSLLSKIAPTKSILRLLTIVLRCLDKKEPVLLVGGKLPALLFWWLLPTDSL
jgi:midasin